MPNLFAKLAAEPRSLTEEMFGRSVQLKIFVSSKMAGGVYVSERSRCADTVDDTRFARAWYWERDANAGPYCSEKVCLGQAATADGLILILGDQLTPITRKEYEVARERRIPTFVFIDQRLDQDADAQEFIRSVRRYGVTKNFENISELETHVLGALFQFLSQSWRRTSYRSWSRSRRRPR